MPTLKQILDAKRNIATILSQEQRDEVGIAVVRRYNEDKSSRSEWEIRNAEALKMALQVREEKTYPWAGASSVKFPLITVAALQFHSRAYPALVPAQGVVKTEVVGLDPDYHLTPIAQRISEHMNYQVLDESPDWEENHDKLLLALPIIGTLFKKVYFDPVRGVNRSVTLLPTDVVVNYWTKSLDEAISITHVIPMSKNYVRERVVNEMFLDLPGADFTQRPNMNSVLDAARDEAQGTSAGVSQDGGPILGLEQHFWMDLDEDGYEEPYIATVREQDSALLRLTPRFFDQGDVIRRDDALMKAYEKAGNQAEADKVKYASNNAIMRINPQHYFVKYGFIPSPDGGFYDLSFGSLLGPVNEAIDTAINQMIDAGTMTNLGGGFLGAGVSIKGGVTEREPNSWITINGRGDDIRKNMLPYPSTPPSQVMYALLEMLISYGERISGATESMSGVSPGQNTPAETSRNTMEQGMKVFSGIFKRIWRAMRQEFGIWYTLNSYFVEDSEKPIAMRQDYWENKTRILPAADPNVVSDAQRLQQATAVMEIALKTPGFDVQEAVTRYLTALKVTGISKLYPGPKAMPPPPNIKLQIEQAKQQSKQLDSQIKMKLGMANLAQEANMNQAKIQNLQAQSIKALAEAKGVESGHQIALIEAQIGAAKHHQDGLLKVIQLMKEATSEDNAGGAGQVEAGHGNAGADGQPQASPPGGNGSVGG